MLQFVIVAASWLEIVVGLLFLFVPGLANVLLFGARGDGIVVPLSRFTGIALVALGVACLPRKTVGQTNSAVGLLSFNCAAAVLFTVVALGAMQHGILTWPAAILHAGITVAMFLRMRSRAPLI